MTLILDIGEKNAHRGNCRADGKQHSNTNYRLELQAKAANMPRSFWERKLICRACRHTLTNVSPNWDKCLVQQWRCSWDAHLILECLDLSPSSVFHSFLVNMHSCRYQMMAQVVRFLSSNVGDPNKWNSSLPTLVWPNPSCCKHFCLWLWLSNKMEKKNKRLFITERTAEVGLKIKGSTNLSKTINQASASMVNTTVSFQFKHLY